MRQVLSIRIFIATILVATTACVITTAGQKRTIWEESPNPNLKLIGGKLFTAHLDQNTSCRILLIPGNIVYVLAEAETEDGYYRFNAMIQPIEFEIRTGAVLKIPDVLQSNEFKKRGLLSIWTPTGDQSRRLFNSLCPAEILRQLPFKFQRQLSGLYEMPGGDEV